MTAFNVLTILNGAGEPLLPSLIAERLIITRGTVTGVIDSLERHGLVRRTTHARDGRMRLIAITAEGSERALRVRGELHREEKRLLSCLTEPQQRQLLSMVARLQANLDTGAPNDSE
jgi:DNA-binding MarR family transcriptional regulator